MIWLSVRHHILIYMHCLATPFWLPGVKLILTHHFQWLIYRRAIYCIELVYNFKELLFWKEVFLHLRLPVFFPGTQIRIIPLVRHFWQTSTICDINFWNPFGHCSISVLSIPRAVYSWYWYLIFMSISNADFVIVTEFAKRYFFTHKIWTLKLHNLLHINCLNFSRHKATVFGYILSPKVA